MRLHGIAPVARLARWNAHGSDRRAEQVIIFAISAAVFIAGAMAGVIGLLRAGIVREERDQSLLDLPATRASVITRRLVGLHVRSPRYVIAADEETDAEPGASASRAPVHDGTGPMTRLPGSVLAARRHAAIKTMAAMRSGQPGRLIPAQITPAPFRNPRKRGTRGRPQPRGQVGDLRLKGADLFPESRQSGGVIRPGRHDLVQVGAKSGELGGQVIDGGGAFGKSVGSGTDEHALARVADHQAVPAEQSDRSPDHRDGDAVEVAQLRRRRNGRAQRQLTRGDLPPKVVSDQPVSGTSDGIDHLAILRHPTSVIGPIEPIGSPGEAQAQNLIHKDKQGVVACCGPLGTRMDAYIPAALTGETGPPPGRSADVSMQQVTRDRGPLARAQRRSRTRVPPVQPGQP